MSCFRMILSIVNLSLASPSVAGSVPVLQSFMAPARHFESVQLGKCYLAVVKCVHLVALLLISRILYDFFFFSF